MKRHNCVEGENLGVEFKPYPYAVTYCKFCRKELRHIAFDDLPREWMNLASDMLQFVRERNRRRK